MLQAKAILSNDPIGITRGTFAKIAAFCLVASFVNDKVTERMNKRAKA